MIDDSVATYIARVFPCEPPCDSFGVCENCCDATLIRIGEEIQQRSTNAALSHALSRIEKLRAALEHIAKTDVCSSTTGPDLEYLRSWRNTTKQFSAGCLADDIMALGQKGKP